MNLTPIPIHNPVPAPLSYVIMPRRFSRATGRREEETSALRRLSMLYWAKRFSRLYIYIVST
jgi:hypothetical protein